MLINKMLDNQVNNNRSCSSTETTVSSSRLTGHPNSDKTKSDRTKDSTTHRITGASQDVSTASNEYLFSDNETQQIPGRLSTIQENLKQFTLPERTGN